MILPRPPIYRTICWQDCCQYNH